MYLQILEKHVPVSLNLLASEYFNTFDETCQKMIAMVELLVAKEMLKLWQQDALLMKHTECGSKMQTQTEGDQHVMI